MSHNHQAAVSLQAVHKQYGAIQALQNISLELHAGEVLGLFGHNGAGKSTLMKLILGVISPSSGTVLSLGHSPRSSGSHHYRQQFGYLPENVSFYDSLSGREVLRYFAKLKGFDKAEAERLLEEVGLSKAANRAIKTYSKGMRQRLGLAQALLGTPKLLILDEPTVGLDPIATSDFYHSVDRLRSQGCSVILCSHVLPGVEAHIDRAMILGDGKQLASGNLDELRQASQLPVEIRVLGISVAQIDAALHPYLSGNSISTAEITDNSDPALMVPPAEKMTVLRQLTADDRIHDIEIRQPSLQDVYSHFTRQVNPAGRRTEGRQHG